jgi:hypothetical protein
MRGAPYARLIQIGIAEDGSASTQDGCAFHVPTWAKELSEFDTELHDDVPWRVF